MLSFNMDGIGFFADEDFFILKKLWKSIFLNASCIFVFGYRTGRCVIKKSREYIIQYLYLGLLRTYSYEYLSP